MDRSRVKARDVAARIPLDYYKKPDPVFKTKTFLWKVAGVVSVVWIASMFAPGKTPLIGSKRFSHGGVCKVHSSFEHECSACHTSFSLFGGAKDADGSFKGDAKCMECHLGNGGAIHSPHQKVSMTPNCGVCHTDHKGANFALKRVGDNHCNVCHKDLEASMEGAQCKYEKNVTSFANNHPEFRSVKADPSKIKFNHKYHMTDGITLLQGGKQFTVKDMADGPMKSALSGRQGADGAVALQCADCHTRQEQDAMARAAEMPDDPLSDLAKKSNADLFALRQKDRGRTSTGELRPPHIAGAYMAPINFDNHCAACHSLKFDASLPAVSHKQFLNPQTKEIAPQEQQLTLLRAEVTKLLAGSNSTAKKPPLLGLPGKSPSSSTPDRVAGAMRSLLEGKRVCGECHVEPNGSDLTVNSKLIAPSSIPAEWFEHARFQHRPHEFLNCRDCHAQAYALNDKQTVDYTAVLEAYAKPRKGAEDVMIPAIDNCRQCHTPKPTLSLPRPARYDCTECHGYHHGKRP